MNFENILDIVMTWVTTSGIKFLTALIVLIIGWIILKRIVKVIKKTFAKRNIDPSLTPFLVSLIDITLKALLVISVASMIGLEMTSFVALLGAAGLAVGMALSGTLQNFAGGVMILIFKPYKVGNYVEMQGYSGSVESIQIFNTILKTPDNKTIIIPNGSISTSSLINYSTAETRRVDFTFGIAYGASVKEARAIILEVANSDERILKDPAVFIGLSEMADSSVNLATRVWVKTPDYWDVYFNINEKIYETFTAKGIEIPFPQMDVHVQK